MTSSRVFLTFVVLYASQVQCVIIPQKVDENIIENDTKTKGLWGIKLPQIGGFFTVGPPFSWKSCGNDSDLVQITTLSVIQTQGLVFRIKCQGILAQNISSPVQGDLQVSKKMFWGWTSVPCVDGIGSCKYTDVCSLSPYSAESCPEEMKSQSLPCSCPINEGSYGGTIDFDMATLKLPSWLEKGRYKIQATLNDASQREILCLQIDMSVK